MSLLTHEGNKLFIDGKEFYLASGSMHYFRYQPGGWRHRLKLMKAFGLTAVQTYVPWNLHEPEKGQYNFSGRLDLKAFLQMCQEEGLYVMLRPAPYICSECDLGGLPYWLLEKDVCLRTMDAPYIRHYTEYFKRLCQEFVPMLSTNGGPIIAVALENEYGSFAMDLEYIRYCEKIHRENGIDVPLYTAGGDCMYMQVYGGFPEIWSAMDVGGNIPNAIQNMRKFQQGFPDYVAEYWGGRAQQWGGYFLRKPPEEVAETYRQALEAGAYVNFYMFCGGTNYGFFSGSMIGTFRSDPAGAKPRYVPYGTSYDVDAPVDEMGRPTKKYFLCREVLAKYRGMDVKELPPVPADMPVQIPGEIVWQESRRLFAPETLDYLTEKKVKAGNVRPMESLNQDYGWILYSTTLLRTDPEEQFMLLIDGLHDRADIYMDGVYKGTYYRDRAYEPIPFKITKETMRLDILVENMGRICFGYQLEQDYKGILNPVRIKRGVAFVTNWEIRSLPMRDPVLDQLMQKTPADCAPGVGPRFFTGSFKGTPGQDAVIDYRVDGKSNLQKGFIRVNGFNLGRYWCIGPQDTLYIPGDIMKEENTIEVFELYSDGQWPTPQFCPEVKLDSLKENVECIMDDNIFYA